ncbi:MAG TPA: hypothetical protein VG756_00020 [Pseudonocardiaceae bacterium]|jgi:hypothetical protein|nr:hypothetical protein [Pseudonocardiaceae bacterium]
MLEKLNRVEAADLDSETYLDDFWPRYQKIKDVFWKLETYQHFREPGVPSWEAFNDGQWERSLRLMADMQAEAKTELAQGDFVRRRVRVVDLPLTPYLQWELNFLKLRAEVGEQIRVVSTDKAQSCGFDALPELVVLGDVAIYEVLYDRDGNHEGARRFDSVELISGVRRDLEKLYAEGEEIRRFFARELAQLPSPKVAP